VKPKVALGIICGFYFLVIGGALVFGAIQFVKWLPRFAVRNAPIVSGHIIVREPIKRTANFTIQLENSEMKVHAQTGIYLLNEIPENVRFHYSGNPSREIYLFEYEENPLWISLTCWACVLFIALIRGRKLIALCKGLFA
jgi:hypothetical protein